MHRLLTLFPIILTIHDAGAGAPGAATAGNTAQAGTAQPANGQQAKPGEAKPVVVYGKQPTTTDPAAGDKPIQQEKPADNPADRKAKFRELISGEFKDEFAEAHQEIFDRRFKDHKTVKEQLDATKPLIDMLGALYKVDGADPKKLMAAIEKDNGTIDTLAEQAGMNRAQYLDALKLKLENASLNDKVKSITEQQEA
jgi:hypothetical protein